MRSPGRSFFLLLIIFFVYSQLEAKTKEAYFSKIYNFAEEDYRLGKRIIERLRFKIFKKQYLRKGDTLKYILQGSDGKLYLFKTYQNYGDENVPNSIFGAKLSSICGIPTPDCYDLLLPMNGRLIYGSLQQIVKDLSNVDYTQPPQDYNCLKYYLFRWLLDDPSPDVYVLPEGNIINIDLDKIRNTNGMDFNDFNYGKFNSLITVCLKDDKFGAYFQEAASFINYVEAFPENKIRELFGPNAYYERITAFNYRLHRLQTEFVKYCQKRAQEENVTFKFNRENHDRTLYAEKVVARLEEKISLKKKILRTLPKNPVMNDNLAVISSPEGISCLDISKAPVNKLGAIINQRIETLMTLRKETPNIYERLALSLSLNRYKQFLPYLGYGVLPLEEVQVLFHPEEIDIRTIEANLRAVNIWAESKELLPPAKYFADFSLDDYYEEKIREKISQINDDSEWAHIITGNCYLYKGDFVNALVEYNKVISLETADQKAIFLAHLLLGYIAELDNDGIRFGPGCCLETAKKEFELAKKINPYSILVKTNLEIVNWLINDSAESANKDVLDGEGHYTLALFYLIKSQPELAERHIAKAEALGYDQELLTDLRKEIIWIQPILK